MTLPKKYEEAIHRGIGSAISRQMFMASTPPGVSKRVARAFGVDVVLHRPEVLPDDLAIDRPELQAGVRVLVTWPGGTTGEWVIEERHGQRAVMSKGVGRPSTRTRLQVRGSTVYVENSTVYIENGSTLIHVAVAADDLATMREKVAAGGATEDYIREAIRCELACHGLNPDEMAPRDLQEAIALYVRPFLPTTMWYEDAIALFVRPAATATPERRVPDGVFKNALAAARREFAGIDIDDSPPVTMIVCATEDGARVLGDAIRPRPKALSLRARYCTCTVPSETPRGTVDDMAPHEHRAECPVAPVPGLHGGMALHPRTAQEAHEFGTVKVRGWRLHTRNGHEICVHRLAPPIKQLGGRMGARDAILMDFYLPPAQPGSTPARLPVDSNPEMECVAARATHEPGRWKAVTR